MDSSGTRPAVQTVQVFIVHSTEKQVMPYQPALKISELKKKVCIKRGYEESDYSVHIKDKYEANVAGPGGLEPLNETLTLGELEGFECRSLVFKNLKMPLQSKSLSAIPATKTAVGAGHSYSSLTDLKLSNEKNFTLTLKVICGKQLDAHDEGGTSDPYVSFKWNKKIIKTKVIDKTLNPVWNETFDLGPFAESDIIKIECWDKDLLLTDDFMGQFTVPLSTIAKEGTYTQWFSLQGRKKSEVVSGQLQLEFVVAKYDANAEKERKKAERKRPEKKSKSAPKAAGGPSRPPNKPPPPTPKSNPTFGVELSVLAQRYPDSKIPPQIMEALEFVRSNGLKEEGIFRIGGVKTAIAALRDTLDAGNKIDYSNVNNVHNVTGLLKMFLRELPTPLLTYDLYDAWLAAAELPEEQLKEEILRLISELPEENRNFLGEFGVLLYQIAEHHETNFMDANNLSIVTGPNLLWDRSRNLDASFSTLSQVGTIVTTIIMSFVEFFPDTATEHGIIAQESQSFIGTNTLDDVVKNVAHDMLSQAENLFKYYDSNGNGTLDKDEFYLFFHELMVLVNMPPPTDEEIEDAIHAIDSDGNDEVDWDEFQIWWRDSHVRYCS